MNKLFTLFILLVGFMPLQAQWIQVSNPASKSSYLNANGKTKVGVDYQNAYFRLNRMSDNSGLNRQTGQKFRIDSIVYNIGAINVFGYSGIGNPTSDTYHLPWGTPYSRVLYAYDLNGRMIERTEQFFDTTASQWINSLKYEYFYTPSGKEDYTINSNWLTASSQWRYAFKIENTYDVNDNLVLSEGFIWNIVTSQWDLTDETSSTYNAFNLPETTIRSVVDQSGTLVPESKTELYYDAGPPVFTDSVLIFYYNNSTMAWDMDMKSQYTLLNANTGDYEVISSFYQGPGTWSPFNKMRIYWDSIGNPIEDVIYDFVNGAWQNTNRTVRTFDNSVLLSDLYVYSYYNNAYRSKITNITGYTGQGNQWVYSFEGNYFWSGVSTGLDEQKATRIKLFPNPAKNNLNVFAEPGRDATIRITDVTGKFIAESEFNSSLNLNVSDWNAGVYLWTLVMGDKVSTGKIIKE